MDWSFRYLCFPGTMICSFYSCCLLICFVPFVIIFLWFLVALSDMSLPPVDFVMNVQIYSLAVVFQSGFLGPPKAMFCYMAVAVILNQADPKS